MNEDIKKILEKIRVLRDEAGLTQAELAYDLSLKSGSAYHKIENNPRITVFHLMEISKVLGVDVKSWFSDLEKEKHAINEDNEKYGNEAEKDLNDIYLLIRDLKREILLLKKEIAGLKAPAPATKKRGSKN